MKALNILGFGLAVLLAGACASQDSRTADTEVKDPVRISANDGTQVKVYSEAGVPAEAAAPVASDRDAYLDRVQQDIQDLSNRVDSLRSRAGLHAKYQSSSRRHLRNAIGRLDGEIGSARGDLRTLRAESGNEFDRDRARMDERLAIVRRDVDRVAAE